MSPQQQAIVDEATSWLKTPYHHQARIKGVGVDCAMILYAIYIDALCLVPPFDFDAYPHDWMNHRSEERFLSHVRANADEVTEPLPGDVALYKFGRCFAHGAVVMQWPTVLHADSRFGAVTIADGEQGFLADRAVKFYRVRQPVSKNKVMAV